MTNTVDHKREDDVVDRFSRRLHKRFGEVFSRNEEHPNFAATPLGGQDKALADYLLAGKGRYCLIEFKADEDAALAETKKPLRHALCRTFQKRAATMARAEDIHFIGWGTKQGTPRAEPAATRNAPGSITVSVPWKGMPVNWP